MSNKKGNYRVVFRSMRPTYSKKSIIGDVSVEVKAYDIKEAMSVASGTVTFDASDPHEICGVELMFKPMNMDEYEDDD